MALTLPPTPFLSHAAGEEGGMMPRPSLWPSSDPARREKGGGEWSSGDAAPVSVNDTETTNQITPLPRCGRGAGGEGGTER